MSYKNRPTPVTSGEYTTTGGKGSFMKESITDDGYRSLGLAIVGQAVADYADALLKKRKKEALLSKLEKQIAELQSKKASATDEELYDICKAIDTANAKIGHVKGWLSYYDGQIYDNENFFYSDWFGILCDLDPDTVIDKVRERMENKDISEETNEAEGVKKVLSLETIW